MKKEKRNIKQALDFGLDFIKKLKPCKWRYNAPLNDGRDHFGFIAQEINEIVNKDDYNFVITKEGYFSVNYYEFIGPIVKAIQELAEKIERLENEQKQQIQKTNNENQGKDDCQTCCGTRNEPKKKKGWWSIFESKR